jgi:signal transduction histidine kinase
LEAGQVLLKRTAVESLKLLYDAVEVVTPLAKEKDQPIMLDVSEELPPVFVDEDMMLRVFINLLENASKYTPSKLPIIVGARRTPS